MNYPAPVKKAFRRLKFSAHDIWQNLRDLRRHISLLVKNIDQMNACVTRSRQIVRGCGDLDAQAGLSGWDSQSERRTAWTSVPAGEKI